MDLTLNLYFNLFMFIILFLLTGLNRNLKARHCSTDVYYFLYIILFPLFNFIFLYIYLKYTSVPIKSFVYLLYGLKSALCVSIRILAHERAGSQDRRS